MKEKIITHCPQCNHRLHIAKLECSECGIVIEGVFPRSRFEMLSDEDLAFIELFLKKHGNIKQVGKELDLSYPTVKNRLNQVVKNLGLNEEILEEETEEENPTLILEKLSQGELSADDAIRLLNERR